MKSLRTLIVSKFLKAFAWMAAVLVMTGSVLHASAKSTTTPTPKGVTGSSTNSAIENALGIPKINASDIIHNIVRVIGLYAGIILVIIAIIKLLVAIKDRDSKGIALQMVLLVVFVAWVIVRTIIR